MELWRVSYEKDAYEDQLGIKHWAYVLHERVTVWNTGRVIEVDDGYGPYLAKLFMSDDMRSFIQYLPIDYFGGVRYVDNENKHWGPPQKKCVDERGEPIG